MADTRTEAEKCTKSVGCAISALVVIEILYYAFEIWKNCPIAKSPKATLTRHYNGGVYSGPIMRRAMRSISNGAARQEETLSYADEHNLAIAALDHWRLADDETVSQCLAAPCEVVAGPHEYFTEDFSN